MMLTGDNSECFCFVLVVQPLCTAEVTENSISYQASPKADGIQAQKDYRLWVNGTIFMGTVQPSYLPLKTQH